MNPPNHSTWDSPTKPAGRQPLSRYFPPTTNSSPSAAPPPRLVYSLAVSETVSLLLRVCSNRRECGAAASQPLPICLPPRTWRCSYAQWPGWARPRGPGWLKRVPAGLRRRRRHWRVPASGPRRRFLPGWAVPGGIRVGRAGPGGAQGCRETSCSSASPGGAQRRGRWGWNLERHPPPRIHPWRGNGVASHFSLSKPLPGDGVGVLSRHRGAAVELLIVHKAWRDAALPSPQSLGFWCRPGRLTSER